MIKHLIDLITKIAVLPLSEEAFLKTNLMEKLVACENGKAYKHYQELQQMVCAELRSKYHVTQLDRINLLLEQYFPISRFEEVKSVNELYLKHITQLSKSFIAHRNGGICLKYWKNEEDQKLFGNFDKFKKIEVWNTFSRQFCIDLLVVNYLLENEMTDECYLSGYYWLINVGDLQLDQILNKGVAETHIHINAGMDFHNKWEELLEIDKRNIGDFRVLKELKDSKYTTNMHIAAILRREICNFLVETKEQGGVSFEEYLLHKQGEISFEEYLLHKQGEVSFEEDLLHKQDGVSLEEYLLHKQDRVLLEEYLLYKQDQERQYWNRKIYSEIISLVKAFIAWEEPKIQVDYKDLYGTVKRQVSSVKDVFSLQGLDTTDENIFLMKVLKYLKKNSDPLLSRIFWQYIRLKNILYSKITQNNYIQGLQYFQEYYGRASHSLISSKEHLRAALKNQIYNNQLTKLEIRLVPSGEQKKVKIKKDIIRILKGFFEVYRDLLKESNSLPQIGIVFHLIKSKDKKFFEKCWCIDPEDNYKTHYFYGELQKQYLDTVDVIKTLRQEVPYLSKYLVGIDAASNENNTEPWVFAPVYQAARDSKESMFIGRKVLYDVEREPLQNIGFTYHVGEDFRHIISGLRHIDEVVEHFGYHVGDRIGHGIALGINIRDWYTENDGIVIMPRIEYLENLLWIWGLGYQEIIDASQMNTMHIEKEILSQAKAIYQDLSGITIYNLWEAYQNRFELFEPKVEFLQAICLGEENTRRKLFEKRNELEEQENGLVVHDKVLCSRAPTLQKIVWTPEKLSHAYHCKCYLRKMYEVIQVDVNEGEIEFLEGIQSVVIDKLDQKGIVVETNPTSNLAISGINRLFNHHVTKLNNVGLETKQNKGLVITVNSDDPTVFNTTISNELAYIFYALQDKGYSRDSILEWINKIRQWGIDTSFIKSRMTLGQELKTEITSEIEVILGAIKK